MTKEKSGKPVPPFEALKLAQLRREIQIGLDDIAAERVVDGEAAITAARDRLGHTSTPLPGRP